MFSKVQIINLGLAKIASSPVSRIDPPQTSLERHVAAGYEHWKRTELAKRRWVFALEDGVQLALVEQFDDRDYAYKYAIPTEALRPVRLKRSEWKQRGRYVYSNEESIRVTLIMNVDEADFDPLFVEVLASRIALESVEYVTQSNTKKADVEALYQAAVADAARSNAYVVGPEDYGSDDNDFPFITERF